MSILLAAALAMPASANQLTDSGTITALDPSYGPVATDDNSPSSCGVAPVVVSAGLTSNYQAYAFRNLAASGACVTVDYTLNCDIGSGVLSQSYAGWFDPTAPTTNFAGGENHCALGPDERSYSVLAPASGTIIVLLTSLIGQVDPVAPYALTVQSDDISAAQAVQATGTLPKSNMLSLHASSLPDGSAVEGTLSDQGAPGHAYSGPVRCLRVSGKSASLVMTFDGTQTGQSASIKGAVYWLHQGTPGVDVDAQRNALLTQRQLDHQFSSCPDPTAPPGGTFNTLAAGDVTVIAAPATS